MKPSPIPSNEIERLSALDQLKILDTPPEQDYDDLTSLAAMICGTPISIISFIDIGRQWLKSKYGTTLSETPREISFCGHTIVEDEFLVVSDLSQDERFFDNPAVIHPQGVRFYAGIPIRNRDGHALGSICVMDRKPRLLTENQISGLQKLARQISNLLRLREEVHLLDAKARALEEKRELLHKTEAKFFAFFNSTNSAIFLLNANLEILAFNNIAEQTFQKLCKKNISIGQKIWDYGEILDENLFKPSAQRAFEGEEVRYEMEIPMLDKKVYHEIILLPVKNKNQETIGISYILHNIDERKKTEAKLAENQRFLETLIKNLPGYSYRVKNDKDYTPEFLSEGITKITGYDVYDYLVERSISCGDEVIEEDKEWVWNKVQDALANKKPYELTYRIKSKSGEEKWLWEHGQGIFNKDGEVEALEGFVTDITKRKKAEDAVKESEKVLQDIFNISPVGLLISRIEDGLILMANESLEKMVGVQPKELLGKYTSSYYSNLSQREVIFDLIKRDGRVKNGEVNLKHAKGHVIHTLVSIEMITLNAEKVLLSGFIDISDRIAVEEKLRQSEKMFSDMAYNVPGVLFQFRVQPDGKTYFSYLSHRMKELFDYSVPLFDTQWHEHLKVPEENRIKFLTSVREAILNKGEWRYESNSINAEGELKWFSAQAIPSYVGNEMIYNGIMVDITERKLAERAIKEREQILQEVFKFSPVPLILSEFGTSNILMASDSIEKLFGVPSQNIIGKKAATFYSNPADRQFIIKELEEKGRFSNGEFDLKRVDGKTIPILSSVETIILNGEKMLLTSLIDISERKAIENALVESEHILQNIFDFSPVPMVISKVNNGQILMANDGLAKLIGIPSQELAKKQTLDFYVELEDRIAIMTEIVKKGKVRNYEIPFKSLDNRNISCMISTEIIKMKGEKVLLTALVDITQRKLIEDALQKSEDNLRTVFENTEVGYILFNDNLEVLSYNTPAQEFTLQEHKMPLVEGTNFIEFFNPDRQNSLKQTMKKVLGGATVQYEIKMESSKGTENWYFIKYSPVSNKDTTVIGFIMAIENITARKKNELELSKSFELVSQQNKRLLNFSYIVSHNLRSHTSNIISMLNLIQMTDDENEKMEMLGMLNDVSHSLNDTILNLNDVVSIQTNSNIVMENANLRSYAIKAIHIMDEQIAAKKAIIENNIDEKIEIRYNAAYLESILFNFISNAIKYSHPNRRPKVRLDCHYEFEKLVLEISDNGIGIDLKKNGDKIFGMYKTFHGNSDAKGIGLFITKNQIEAMGGKVEVMSEINSGTTFKIYF